MFHLPVILCVSSLDSVSFSYSVAATHRRDVAVPPFVFPRTTMLQGVSDRLFGCQFAVMPGSLAASISNAILILCVIVMCAVAYVH